MQLIKTVFHISNYDRTLEIFKNNELHKTKPKIRGIYGPIRIIRI